MRKIEKGQHIIGAKDLQSHIYQPHEWINSELLSVLEFPFGTYYQHGTKLK